MMKYNTKKYDKENQTPAKRPEMRFIQQMKGSQKCLYFLFNNFIWFFGNVISSWTL